MTASILILEDDADVARIFRRELEAAGMTVAVFRSLREVRAAADGGGFDLCVLDPGLPDGDGLDLLRQTLSVQGVPTIVVSGRGSLDDRLAGFAEGADDYLAKPAEPAELLARVRSVLRRSAGRAQAQEAEPVAAFAGWRYDPARLTLTDPDGGDQSLPRADADLLDAFLAARGRVVTRDWLIERLFDDAGAHFDRSVDVRVSRLRKRLGDPPRQPRLIRTVYGAGYVFTAAVTWEAPA